MHRSSWPAQTVSPQTLVPSLLNSKRRAMKITPAIQTRCDELRTWLEKNGRNCWARQAHLSNGTPEQIYWHFGYYSALRDILNQLDGR